MPRFKSGLFFQNWIHMRPTVTLYGVILLAVMVGYSINAVGQLNSENIHGALLTSRASLHLRSSSRVNEFYGLRNYRPVWTTDNTKLLLAYLDQCESLGLNSEDYECAQIDSLRVQGWEPNTGADSLWLELGLTDVALDFLLDITCGNAAPYFAYNGWKRDPDISAMLRLINHSFDRQSFVSLIPEIELRSADYLNAKLVMNRFQNEISVAEFRDVIVTSNRADSNNRPLMYRLKQLMITDSVSAELSSREIIEKIKSAQRLFNIFADGKLSRVTLMEINRPLYYRIEELKATLNTLRWLSVSFCYDKAVIVNIPSASLRVYENEKLLLESKTIVGTRSSPTPTLSSTITEVILYPYWMVPKRIATRELLPIIKKDIGYLNANGLQVLNLQGTIVNPYHVEWNRLSESYFPYVLRQSTGCDNSLGLVKINFYNPFTVYLHDTPWKNLFTFTKRYFSHGCIRVEKAIDLGRLLLKNNEVAIDTITQKGCLKNQSPITIPATNPFPVLVLYQTAWTDSSGRLSFHEDIYQRLRYPSPKSQLTKPSLSLKE